MAEAAHRGAAWRRGHAGESLYSPGVFGHVLVEAMAAGVPVVATDCPHGPRDIVRDGVTGRLVPVGDRAALSGAVGALLDDPAGAAAMARAAGDDCRRFAADRIAARYLDLFKELLRS